MTNASFEARGRWRLPALLAVGLLLLAGCSGGGGGYTFAWYILSPADGRGQANLSFLLTGFWATISISTLAMGISLAIGLMVALMGISKRKWVKRASRVYVEFFRSIPLLVMILWVYYGLPSLTGIQFGVFVTGLIYLPLLVPQIGFLYGLHVVFLSTGAMTGLAAVIWAQGLFVFPYVMIALSDPWRALDPRLIRAAEALGAGPWRRLFAVKLPVLLQPLLTAAAVGVAVSVAQYLPTLFLGAGRVPTLTTEAVTLSSGSDRRVTGAYATLQAVLPFACYTLAFLVPALLYRNRRDLSGAQ